MAQPVTTGRQRHGPSRLLLPAATMAGLALALSFGATAAMERILSAQGGEAVEHLAAGDRDAPDEPRARVLLPLADYQQAILGRDIFATHGGSGGGGTPHELGPMVEGAELIATVVAEDRGASSALIATAHGDQQVVQVYGPGDALAGQGTIARIDQGRVTVHDVDGEALSLLLGVRAEL